VRTGFFLLSLGNGSSIVLDANPQADVSTGTYSVADFDLPADWHLACRVW